MCGCFITLHNKLQRIWYKRKYCPAAHYRFKQNTVVTSGITVNIIKESYQSGCIVWKKMLQIFKHVVSPGWKTISVAAKCHRYSGLNFFKLYLRINTKPLQ